MTEEWGPWIEHDGMPCPCVGAWVHYVRACGVQGEARATGKRNECGSAWHWATTPEAVYHMRLIRYRIRKPKGLTILEELLEDLPERVDA